MYQRIYLPLLTFNRFNEFPWLRHFHAFHRYLRFPLLPKPDAQSSLRFLLHFGAWTLYLKYVTWFSDFKCLGLITVGNLIFILSFLPHLRDMAWIQAADCFWNNGNDWFASQLSKLLAVSGLLCVILLTGEILMIATISFFIPNIRAGFWTSNSFVIIAVFVAITFSVCCFLIFDRALGDG